MPDEEELDRIFPPFNSDEMEKIREALDEAQIDPADHFKLPQKPSQTEPGNKVNPDVPEGRILENYNGQRGNGTFYKLDFHWQPGCEEKFAIVLSELWTGPPPKFATRFKQWAAFATLRAILICKKNRNCRRPIPLGCESTWDVQFPNGTIYGRARFVFECVEL